MTVTAYRSQRIVLPDDLVDGVLRVDEGGTILDIRQSADPSDRLLDLGALAISPGLVDTHVHVNEPGRTEWEGYTTATRAAAAGGVTCLVDMPLNCIPATVNRAALAEKVAACGGQCHVDVGFWGGVIPDNVDALPGLAAAGALGCKAFLVDSGVPEFPCVDESALRLAMPRLRELGLPLLAHAELDLGACVDEEDPRSYRGYLQSRPSTWEDAAIQLLVELSRETGCHVHVVHLSAATSLPTIAAAKREGLPITVETCPHYLCLAAEDVPDGATEFKCAPPIRERENQEALWRGLFDGVIDFVVTDHSPCTPALKERERGHFEQAWGGIASLQLGLPSLWTQARRRGATLGQLAAWTSERSARFAGLGTKKGRIAPGYDADLVVWDPDDEGVVVPERLFFRHRQVSPYLGARLHGRVHRTVLRGQEIFDGETPTGQPRGQLLLGRDRTAGRQVG